MAYPRGQFQQPPSNSSYGSRQPPYVQQQQLQYNYQQVPSSRNRNERPYQDFSSRSDKNLPAPLHVDPNYNSPQWQNQSAQWSSEAEQPYTEHREYAGHSSSYMRPRQGAYQDRMDESYDTGGPSAGPLYSHDQDPSWSRQSPQMTGPPQEFHRTREHGSSPHLKNNYDGAGPAVRMNGHHASGAAQGSNATHDTMYHGSPGQGSPWGQSAQQQRSRPAQDVKSKNAVWARGARDPQAQQHAPESRNGRPKKPGQSAIALILPLVDVQS
ncbi:MAG: hypothetical protein LQ337_007878 [Flavoplaca oasis]|nr:MAG: hypothetical protein LQ337_007878 [Flavoplaca oasis]